MPSAPVPQIGEHKPKDDLIEANIRVERDGKEPISKKADLVLLSKRLSRGDRWEINPLLVIEVKKRIVHRTQSYQAYARQAWNYTVSIGAKYYSFYDTNTMVFMQIPEPYVIGLLQVSSTLDEAGKARIASRM